jgi:hypothetical protein
MVEVSCALAQRLGIYIAINHCSSSAWSLDDRIKWAQTAKKIMLGNSVAHESRTPHYGLEFLEFLMDLGRASFTGLTGVKARVHIILFEFMKITVKTQNNETLSYSQRPERP